MEAGKPWRARSVVQIRADNGLDQGAGGRTGGLDPGSKETRRTTRIIPQKLLSLKPLVVAV